VIGAESAGVDNEPFSTRPSTVVVAIKTRAYDRKSLGTGSSPTAYWGLENGQYRRL